MTWTHTPRCAVKSEEVVTYEGSKDYFKPRYNNPVSYVNYKAGTNPEAAVNPETVPFLIRLATPIPISFSLATSTRTAGREERDEDADTDEIHLPSSRAWECAGAVYDECLQLWLKNKRPLVLDSAFTLGTKSVTNVVKEEQDED
jgi:hypothetical protein